VDVAAHPALAKQLSGIVSQQNTLDRQLTVWENLYFHGRLFGIGAKASRRTADELLEQFQLSRWAGASVYALSGGMAQRLMVARAILHDPAILFLDEPTAGLDPQVRREIYTIIEELKKERKTILLTTHYIEEAEKLCDRVAIVDQGRVVTQGTPRELKQRSAGTTRIELRLARPESDAALRQLEGVADCHASDGVYVMHSTRVPQTIVSLVKYLEAQGNELSSLDIAAPSLEDVFLELTGRSLRD
jgi:ABC-2 type transport system ATP-binding protein